GDEWVLSGIKLFVPDALAADYILCVARTTDSTPEKGLTIFLVKTKTKGVNIAPLKTISKDKQYEISFNNVCLKPESINPCNYQHGRVGPCRGNRWSHACGSGHDRGLCQRKGSVRAAHRQLPGNPTLSGRHVGRYPRSTQPGHEGGVETGHGTALG
ncbi:MAG: acyl-CoA dehydrogenase family protein, partial [Deltaproteobacteria bacterium]|nr:acyl-CoA dehydrogenase family protein [Deltaproteobacteria bacterium]